MDKVENALFELGITPDLAGFSYICSAVKIIQGSKKRTRVVDGIYSGIAKEFDVTTDAVEQGIRYAFGKIDRGSEAYKKYIGVSGKANSALLYALAYKLKESETDGSRNNKQL